MLETSPLDVEVNGTPMSVLLGQAVKLKSAQEKPLRKVFDSFPTFYQNSISTKCGEYFLNHLEPTSLKSSIYFKVLNSFFKCVEQGQSDNRRCIEERTSMLEIKLILHSLKHLWTMSIFCIFWKNKESFQTVVYKVEQLSMDQVHFRSDLV